MRRLVVKQYGGGVVEYEVLSKRQASLRDAGFLGAILALAACAIMYHSTLLWLWSVTFALYVLSLLSMNISQSLHILPPHGLQLSTRSLLGSRVQEFLPAHLILDIVINEGLQGFNVRYYLAVIMREGANTRAQESVRVVVPFQHVNPGMKILEEVYHATREALFDEYDTDSELALL